MEPKIKVWVIFEAVKFGDGRAALLDLIDSLGSISQAAARSGMSYRNLWGYLRELEAAAGFRFLERRRGQAPRAGRDSPARAARSCDATAAFASPWIRRRPAISNGRSPSPRPPFLLRLLSRICG